MTLVPFTIYVPASLVPAPDPDHPPRLIGIAGRPYAGKDTVAHHLVQHYRFVHGAFGDPIKLVTMQLYGLSLAQVTTGLKDRIDPRWNKTPRELLQHTGRSARQAAPDVWVRHLMANLVHPMLACGQSVVISDVREPIEAEAIRKAGGILWRVHRPDADQIATRNGMTTASRGDQLEQGLEDLPVEAVLRNDDSLAALYRAIDNLMPQSRLRA